MIARYTRPAMGRIWSEENKYRMWLDVEATASEVLADAGIVPPSAARAIRAYGEVDVARIQEIEAEVKHDVIAFTTAMAEKNMRRSIASSRSSAATASVAKGCSNWI